MTKKEEREQEKLLISMAVRSFTLVILHGDEAHRKWLIQACEDFIAGKPVQNQSAERTA